MGREYCPTQYIKTIMTNNISIPDLQASIANINLLYNNYNILEKENTDLKKQLERKKIDVSELKAELRERKIKIDLYDTKCNNQLKRIAKLEEVYSTIPGTTKEDKSRFLLFITDKILPWIIESANSRTFKKIVEFWDYFLKKEKSNKKKYTGGYYVYSHTIIGEKFPFYIGFSRNNDGQYNRSKDFTCRHETWHEYVSMRGNNTDIEVNIIGEVKTEEAAIELEKFYIRHYAGDVVNILSNPGLN
jgi:hypothetical protein